MKKNTHTVFDSLAKLHKALGMCAPLHPLVTVANYYEAEGGEELANGVLLHFYQIALKDYFDGSIKYGQNRYDFEAGGLLFMAPNQLIGSGGNDDECEGMTLMFHPDLLKGHELAKRIKTYTFFSYNSHEALQLSDPEKETIKGILRNIQHELEQRIDPYSQKVVIGQIELLLTYGERFYARQFITRRPVYNDLLAQIETLLDDYFSKNLGIENGLPTVQYLADKLTLSPGYLSDLLRSYTGMNAQQHIHQKLVETAKIHLTENRLSIAQIAYQLGFEHPQSFSKLFRKKTDLSPAEYRNLR